MGEGGVAGLSPSLGEAEALLVGESGEPGVEDLVEGGVVYGAEAVCLVVFVLVPSFGEAYLLRVGDPLEVFDHVIRQGIQSVRGHRSPNILCKYNLIKPRAARVTFRYYRKKGKETGDIST